MKCEYSDLKEGIIYGWRCQ